MILARINPSSTERAESARSEAMRDADVARLETLKLPMSALNELNAEGAENR